MSTLRSGPVVALVLVLAIPFAVPTTAQSVDTRLLLSADRLSLDDQDTNCLNEGLTYAMASTAPATGSAVLGGSGGATPCTTRFVFNVTDPIILQGVLRVRVVLQCDPASLAAGPTSGLPTLRLVLAHNDENLLNNATAVPLDRCATGDAKSYDAQATLANRTVLSVRDQLVLRIVSAWVNPPSSTGKGVSVVTGPSESYLDLPVSRSQESSPAPTTTSTSNTQTSEITATTASSSPTTSNATGAALTRATEADGVPGAPVAALFAAVAAIAVALSRRKH